MDISRDDIQPRSPIWENLSCPHNQCCDERRNVLRNRRAQPHSGGTGRGVHQASIHKLHNDSPRPDDGHSAHSQPVSCPSLLHAFPALHRLSRQLQQQHHVCDSMLPRP